MIAQNTRDVKIDLAAKDSVVENLRQALISNYVFPDRAKLMATYIREQDFKGKYDSITNPKTLANELFKDLHFVNDDKHLRIEYDPQLEKDILKFISSKKDRAKISEAEIAEEEKKNFFFKKIEILPSNIGYLEFSGFARPGASSRKTINAAMQFVSHTDALIIDLRNNFGGDGNSGEEMASYFFNSKTYTGRSFNRIENKWTDHYIENKKIITGGLVLNMPIYILTSKRTFSAAEGLAFTLKNLKKAVVIGDTTKGGAYLTRSFSLGHGFVGFIPYLRSENDWERTGVIPDISTAGANSLPIAQNVILDNKLSQAVDETEKHKIKYAINYNRSKNSIIVVDTLQALKYIGRFEEFEVTLQGEQLMFRDTNQPTRNYKKMIAISPTFFQVGNDYQVEFIVESEVCKFIRMYWDDGYEDKSSRSNR